MEYFKTVLNLGTKYQSILGYGALSLLAAVGEKVFSTIVYRCPCNSWNYVYGLVFLLVPALILLLLGYMLSSQMWKQVTGCCNSGKSKHCCQLCGRGLRFLQILCQVTCISALPPMIWIALALMNGSYYECIVSGLNWNHICAYKAECIMELPRIPCAESFKLNLSEMEVDEIQRKMRAESQVLGWSLIASVLILAVLFSCISRCFSPVSYLQLHFWKTYLEKEHELFDLKSKEHAASLAERNVNSFFEQNKPEPFLSPTCKEWHQISSTSTFNKKKQYYSTIHKFVELYDRQHSIKSLEGDTLLPTEMHFVDVRTSGFESGF
ncbi:calcium homeostasis modulator protein 6 [Rhinophrynus dorsalis]